MGNDGGSIPLRQELVKQKSKVAQLDIDLKRSLHKSLFTQCSLSGASLRDPIVSCGFGRLYNKEAILEMLLNRSLYPNAPAHITSIRDVLQLSMKKNEETDRWMCPLSRHEFNEAHKFVYIVPCGHVFELSAFQTVGGNECVLCSTAVNKDDIIPINPSTEQEKALKERLEKLAQQGKTHSLKKIPNSKKNSRKEKKRKLPSEASTTEHRETKHVHTDKLVA
ncbi:replication termination factor Rtf2 [Schizosaccharomyces japonicus yFS275]|uniref:Replication termination factor Rtf2 n=1 Tax=Schizosaccharomyces japonicus (strain yFS275 / FY16936) TaxID=402676 RepID=B6JX70_SCHJY|nr:replication termination factor Rtf2 [Schizosaccharomyces japonicus yFS275]EEB05971.2 replication termination factor Rtf2 [Schizosaccharomyces japonicus yFS275]